MAIQIGCYTVGSSYTSETERQSSHFLDLFDTSRFEDSSHFLDLFDTSLFEDSVISVLDSHTISFCKALNFLWFHLQPVAVFSLLVLQIYESRLLYWSAYTGAILKTQITFCMWIKTHAFSMCEDHVIVNVFFVICAAFL